MYVDLCLVIVGRVKHDDIVVQLYSYLAVKLEFDDIVCRWTAIFSTSLNENKADPTGASANLFIYYQKGLCYLFIYLLEKGDTP